MNGARWKWLVALALVIALGAWLRLGWRELVEFKSDEAVAAHLALQFVEGGRLPTAGLMSSVGVTNPPLFIYLLIPLFLITKDPGIVSAMIGVIGLAGVVMAWRIGCKYYGRLAGLVTALLFATAPWAVIYSRKIWAQDFVPVLAVATMWSVHALVLGKQPRAIFWVLLLPLCVVQIHFSGLALTAAVVAILLWLRPRLDWRYAVGAVVVAVVLVVPYLRFQSANNWAELRRVWEQRSGRNWQIPPGMTIQPHSGYPLPRRPSESWIHALAIGSAGQMEDVLGLSAGPEFDKAGIWRSKPGREYFASWAEGLMLVQRVALAVLFGWLAVQAVRTSRRSQRFPWFMADEWAARYWILVLWVAVPLVVYWVAGLWTYLSYYAILFPAHFLALGAAAERVAASRVWQPAKAEAPRRRPHVLAVLVAVVVLAAANLWFMLDLYRFLARYGGAQGTYGTVLAYKVAAARCLAEQADAEVLMQQRRLVQMDRLGQLELPQFDLVWLAKQFGAGTTLGTNVTVIVVDENRTDYDPQQVPQLVSLRQTNFGPMRLYFVEQP